MRGSANKRFSPAGTAEPGFARASADRPAEFSMDGRQLRRREIFVAQSKNDFPDPSGATSATSAKTPVQVIPGEPRATDIGGLGHNSNAALGNHFPSGTQFVYIIKVEINLKKTGVLKHLKSICLDTTVLPNLSIALYALGNLPAPKYPPLNVFDLAGKSGLYLASDNPPCRDRVHCQLERPRLEPDLYSLRAHQA